MAKTWRVICVECRATYGCKTEEGAKMTCGSMECDDKCPDYKNQSHGLCAICLDIALSRTLEPYLAIA